MSSYFRSSISGLLRSPRNWRRSIVVLLIGVVIVVVITMLAAEFEQVRLALRDLHAITSNGKRPPWFAAWLTYAGSVGWFGASTISFFTWWLLRSQPQRARVARLFAGFSILTFIMGFDDLFMLHDGVIWFVFGIGEKYLMVLWVLFALIWGLIFLPDLLSDPDMPIFAGAIVCFAFGIAGDVIPAVEALPINEEAAKLAGIVLWGLWVLFAATRAITKEFSAPARPLIE